MRLYLDTETTSYYEFHLSWSHDSQPACSQIAAVLETEDGKTVAALSALIAPRWPGRRTQPTIDARITKLCGIDDEQIAMYGQDPQLVWNQLSLMMRAARLMIAHNEEFDTKILRRFATDLGLSDPIDTLPPRFCTIMNSVNLVGLPGRKKPNLKEAFYWATGRQLSSHHDALNDVYACRQVYRAIMRSRAPEASKEETAT